ncbi:golgin subfamily A member 6-like protein 22 [Lineus longissimus]|uniref:golgin subfamily A member 6-like protein 22 n=1 Tax=Lineus longissimus TaxID=88925 RepID=UPI00315D70E8
MQLKAASADSFGIRVADYSLQNDTVFALSAENKHWKRKYVEELALRREEETLRKNELKCLHADIAAVEEKAKNDQKEWCLREFVRSQEYNQAEEDFRNKQEELTTKLNYMKFKHGLDIFGLEERFSKEAKEIRNACDRMVQERQEDRAETIARMNGQLDEARSKSERLVAMVSRLKEERAIEKMIVEMADSTYIDNKLREKEAEYVKLQERFVKLGKEKERVVLEAEEREERLVKEFQAKEADMLSNADERRKSVLKERREAAAREWRVVREAKSRLKEARAEGEQVVAELKRVSEQVQSDMREEFEERIRKLRGEFGKQGMRLLKASREREDHLRAELAKEVELRRSVEEDAKKQMEEYQDLVREMNHLSECLSMEKARRVEERGDALRERAGLDSLIEQQRVEFEKYSNAMETEKHQRECVSDAERKSIVKMQEVKMADMTARQATLEHQLKESDTKRKKESLMMLVEKNRLLTEIDVLGSKRRHQKASFVEERYKLENAKRAEKDVLNQKYDRLAAELTAALGGQEMLFGIRIECDQERYEEAQAKAADEHDQLLELIEARRQEDELKGTLERNRLSGMVERLRAKCKDQETRHEQECRELEADWEEERDAWAEKYDSMNAELELTKMAYDMELESEKERRLEEESSSFEKSEQFVRVIKEYKVLLEDLKSNHDQEQSQLKDTCERKLVEMQKRHEVVMAEIETQWHDFERRVEDEVDHCEELEREVAELQRKREWETIGTGCWVAIMKRHHKVDLDNMRCRLESCEGELSVAKNRSTVLMKSIEKQEAADTARANNHKAEIEQLTRRVETSESEQSVANARASYYLEKLRRTEQTLEDAKSVHQEAVQKGMELIGEFEEECAELKAHVVKKSEALDMEKEIVEQSETVLEWRERDVMQWERTLDAREENLQESKVMMMNGLADLSKQEMDLKNLQEKLKQEEVNILKTKEDLVTEKGSIDARVAEIKKEEDRLQDIEIDMEQREKEARRSLDSAQKVPDRLPIDQSLGELTDTKEQLVAMQKQLTEQEWYFLAREGEFQEAKVEVNRYRKREEKMKLLELELQEKTTGLQGMEVAMRVKKANIDSTMLEVDGIRRTLSMDRRYKARRNRGCQATQEKIAADLEAVHGSSLQCGDEVVEQQNRTTNTEDNSDTKLPKEDEASFQGMKSRRSKVIIHYDLEEDACVEKEESDTKPVGIQKRNSSVMDQVYEGPQFAHPSDRMAHPNFRHGGPHPQNFCRPPPPGYHPMRPHPAGRPHPRMGPPPPYGPRPHGPGYGPPHLRGPRPGFYRPHGPYGQPPHNGARRQHPSREDPR